MTNYTNNEIEQLVEDVRRRLEEDERYAWERQKGYEEKRERRIYEIIVDVVRSYYGRVVQEVVYRLRRLLSLE
jgi:hypothetical protein